MNEKYSLKIIQHGKTQQVRTVQNGAGMAGQAVVIQATDAARYQLVNVVTLVSPSKLQLKRVGDALHLVLPGGDIDAPDLVIQDYFKVTGASLQGSSISGEWMNYDTVGLATNPAPSVPGTDTLSSSVVDKTTSVSLGGEGVLGTFTKHSWLWAGGIAGAAAATGGGGGGGSTAPSDTSPLGIIQNYANATNGAGVAAPTLTTYKDAGVKGLANLSETTASADIDSATVTGALGVTSAAWLTTLNTALDKRTDGSTLTVAQIQAMVDSYYRILSEADGVVNTTTDVDVYPAVAASDPTSTDYTNIGATVGNAKSVDLLNDFVGQSAKTAVDTVDELNVVAKAAYNVMRHAGVVAGSGTEPALYSLDSDWVAGLTALGVTGVTTSNITAVKAAIAGTASLTSSNGGQGVINDGLEVDTVQEIKDLLKPVVAQQVLREYTDTNGTSTAPTLTIYTDAGIKTFKSLLDTGVSNRKALNDSSTASGAESNTFLTAAILNTALDKLAGTSLTYDATYTGTVQKMVDSYYRILRETDGKYIGDSNGGATYYNNFDVAHTADTDVYNDSTNDGTNATNYNDPTLGDYANIGITVADAISTTAYNTTTAVGNETLDLLNDAIGRMSTASVDTAGEIETLATTANDVMLLAKGTNTSASQTDANLITGLNLLLGLNTTTGVNTANLAAVKAAIVSTADLGTGVNTADKLLGVVTLVRLSEFTDDGGTFYVSNASNTKTTLTPTLNDWTLADGGTGVLANISLVDSARISLNQTTYWKTTNPINGLNALNSALDTYDKSLVNQTLLQNIVDSYGRVLQEADGSRATSTDVKFVDSVAGTGRGTDVTQADLAFLGVNKDGNTDDATIYGAGAGQGSGLNYQKTGELLASAIGSLSSTSVDTLYELNNLTGYAEAVMKHAAGVVFSYTDSEWVTALNSLLNTNTVTGVNINNIADIKSAIDTVALATTDVAAVDTWDELQAIVSLVRLDDYAALSNGWTTPTITDYQSIAFKNGDTAAYTGVKSAYLGAYNDAVNSQTTITEVGVKDMVAKYTLLLDSADSSRLTAGTNLLNTDFAKIWGVSVAGTNEATLLNDVINGLATSSLDQVSELIALATTANKIVTLSGGTAQGISRQELANLGLNDGAGHSFTDINSGTGTYWITDAEYGRFTSTTGLGSIGDATPSTINTWQQLQDLVSQAIINA